MHSRYALENVQHMLRESGIACDKVAAGAGVAYNTVRAIKDGSSGPNPTISTLQRIEEWLWSTKEGASCDNCLFCQKRDHVNKQYNCEMAPGAWAEQDPVSCQMHTPNGDGNA